MRSRASGRCRLEELGQVWMAAPQINPTFGAMVRLLILTGCRRSEIADLEWGEIDLARAVIEIPGERTKNGLPLVVPLPPVAVAILAGVPRMSTARVFSGFRAWCWAKGKLDDLVQIPAWVVHDIRRSVSTGLREHLSADVHLIELILNHQSGTRGAIAGVYDRSQRLAERRELLAKWAELITDGRGRAGAGQGRERRADREGGAMTAIRVILTLRLPGRDWPAFTVEGELLSSTRVCRNASWRAACARVGGGAADRAPAGAQEFSRGQRSTPSCAPRTSGVRSCRAALPMGDQPCRRDRRGRGARTLIGLGPAGRDVDPAWSDPQAGGGESSATPSGTGLQTRHGQSSATSRSRESSLKDARQEDLARACSGSHEEVQTLHGSDPDSAQDTKRRTVRVPK